MAQKIDAATLKSHCRGQAKQILNAVAGIPAVKLDGQHHACPFPGCPDGGGKDRFRLIDADTGACLCSKCQPEKCGDYYAAIMKMQGCNFPDAVGMVADWKFGGNDHLIRHAAQANGNGRHSSNGKARDIVADVAHAKRMPLDAFKVYGAEPAMRGKLPVARVPVYSAAGEAFSHFDLTPNGKGWFKEGKGNAGLFLPGRKPAAGETWLVTEGVKDSATLFGLGYLACGLPTSEMHAKYAHLFTGVHVVLVPDRDAAGVNGAKKSAGRLYGGAVSVKIAHLPAEIVASGGADVRDVLAREQGEQSVRAAIEAAAAWQPPKPGDADADEIFGLLLDKNQNDTANAGRLVAKAATPIRYCGQWEKWFVWTGQRWEHDVDNLVESYAKDVGRSLFNQIEVLKVALAAASAGGSSDPDAKADAEKAATKQVAGVVRFAKASASRPGVDAMKKLARSEAGVPIDHEKFDADPWLLNCENGVLDLRTGKLGPHDPKQYMLKLAPVRFQAGADCPRWRRFIFEITKGDDDLAAFLKRLIGYTLTGAVTEQILPICWGEGSNGKSVLLGTTQALLGDDYAMKAPHDFLMMKHGEQHPCDKADLFKKRFVSAIEVDQGRRLHESLIKELTGGDKIRARRMRENYWEYSPTHKIWLATNHKPEVRGTDHAVWRRLRLIPFTAKFEGPAKDKNLSFKLLDELPGILNWALAGCLEWQAGGLQEPESVLVATSNYREQQDIIGEFIDECCVLAIEAEVYATPLYTAYHQWASVRGEHPITQRRFGEQISEKGFHLVSGTGNKKKRIGIGLLHEDREA